MADYVVVPKSSMDATADAIREKTGSQSDIEWTQDGFADAIDEIEGGADESAWLLKAIVSINNSSVTSLPAYSLYGMTQLTSVSLPNVTSIGDNCIQGCTSLQSVYLPNLTALGTLGIGRNNNAPLSIIVLPKLTSMNSQALRTNYNLETIDVANVSSIGGDAFREDSSLTTLILRRTSGVSSIGNISTFTDTPFASGGSGGTLYVPNDLISSYQSATNWSTILGYTNNQIKSIESTHTDLNADIDLTLYYADGTAIGGGS